MVAVGYSLCDLGVGWDNLRCSYLANERSRVEPTSAAQASIQSACVQSCHVEDRAEDPRRFST
jgi:hypothetical protein